MAYCALSLRTCSTACLSATSSEGRPPRRTTHIQFSSLFTRAFCERLMRLRGKEEGKNERGREGGREAVDLLFFSCCCRARSLPLPRPLHSRSVGAQRADRQSVRVRACVRAQCALQREFVRLFARSSVRWVGWITGYHSGGGLTVAAIVVRPAERNERRRATVGDRDDRRSDTMK